MNAKHPASTVFDALALRHAAHGGDGPTRRRFLAGGATLGAALGAPLLASCLGDYATEPPPEGSTLFFDFSHHADFANRSYFLVGGGQRYALVKVSDKPEVLAQARMTNAFLAEVPDQHITHHVEGAVFAADAPTLTYVASDFDAASGAWAMSAVHLYIPPTGSKHAYARARAATPGGPLPLSARRRRYGVRAAQTEQDLADERVLLDPCSHAATIIGAHPELCSLETNSAHSIHSNYIDSDPGTKIISDALGTTAYGPATPEAVPGVANPVGWGTLTPVIDDITGKPFKNASGKNKGYIHYLPTMNADIVEFAGQTMAGLAATVRNDETLGLDVTGLDPKLGDPANPAHAGKMWTRQDGTAFADLGALAVGAGGVVMTQKQDPAQYLLRLTATSSTVGTTTTVSLTLQNSAARFLGVYLQFFADAHPDTPLTLTSILEYNRVEIIPGHDNKVDETDAMFIGMVGAVAMMMGIPVAPAVLTSSFKLPAGVTAVRVLCSGIGSGANNYPNTLVTGEVMTGIVSYGVTSLLCGLGAAASVGLVVGAAVTPVMSALAQELVLLVSTGINDAHGAKFWHAQAVAFGKFLLNFLAGRAVAARVARLCASCAAAGVEGAAEDAIPVAGWIMLGISVAVGVASLAETSIEVALSPYTYIWDLGFTHDITVTLTRDSGNATFPAGATHCIVTAAFDDAIPHKVTLALPTPAKGDPMPVAFPSVPLGGKVSVSVAFIQQPLAGQASVLLGKGSSGSLDNQPGVAPAIQITQLQFPLGPSTTYRHRRKTALTVAGKHYWNTTRPAPVATSVTCDQAGSLCALRSISVRQGTGKVPGYVGYAWQGQNLDAPQAPGCRSNGTAQIDQMANANTLAGDAASGYAVTACGFESPGVHLAYDLMNTEGGNFYLDTSGSESGIWHLRQVVLDGAPDFGRGAGQSLGVLNFLPDALLLHPTGHIVSISSANHKMETLRLRSTPVADAVAVKTLIAQTHGGVGKRPGLMTQPVTAAVTADGTIIVLENGDPGASPPVPTRLQAMTVGGNPKPHFVGQQTPYFFELTATPVAQEWTLLDVAVEYTGVIYVLAVQGDGPCRMDVYLHDQKGTAPLFSTSGVNAGKLAVDFWRSIYTLNNEVIQRDDGAAPGLTEPSVSVWEPCEVGRTCV